jgi:hypothetical protein
MYSGSTVGAHTYQLATNPPAFTLNPDAGLTLRNSELEGAIEFTLSFPATWTDYMDLTVGHSFTQMKEIGCYTLLRTESWINGMTVTVPPKTAPESNGLYDANAPSVQVNSCSLALKS